MNVRRIVTTAAAAVLAPTLAVAAPSPAGAEEDPTGTRSLAEVLTSDGNRFDRDAQDYDILTEAVLAVVEAKPDSPVGLLTQGDVALTAFVPNDLSFRLLANDVVGRWYRGEKRTFDALVEAVGVDAVESVLLYHVIPGATIDSATALQSDGAALTTAQGGSVTVDVLAEHPVVVRLEDQDADDIDPFLDPSALDLNEGNAQIAHGIYFVLRPVDLP